MRPGRSLITNTRSDRKIASGMLCVISSTVLREFIQMRCSSRFMRSRVIASSAPKGSSISSTDGSCSSARRIATRCCMPPESCHGYFCSKPCNPAISISACARLRAAAIGRPRISACSRMLSSTRRHGSSSALWNTMPTSVCGPRTAWPDTSSAPPLIGSKPATIFISVLLPQPEGPTTETNSPARMSKSSALSVSTSPSRVR